MAGAKPTGGAPAALRGYVVTVALQGDLGKPRPALIVQSDLFREHPSVTVLPITSELHAAPLFRLTLQPESANGLQQVSQLMIDKPQSVSRQRLGRAIGRLSAERMVEVNRALALFLGLG